MKTREITEGWLDTAKGVAKGVGNFVQGATGIKDLPWQRGGDTQFINDFVKRLSDKIKMAISDGKISTDTSATYAPPSKNTLTRVSGHYILTSGIDGKQYQLFPRGLVGPTSYWISMTTPSKTYPPGSEHEKKLTAAMQAIIAANAAALAGPAPALAEATGTTTMNTISRFVSTYTKQYLFGKDMPPAGDPLLGDIDKAADLVQKTYIKDKGALAIKSLGKLVYQIALQRQKREIT